MDEMMIGKERIEFLGDARRGEVGMSASSNGSTRNCFDRDDQWIGVRFEET